MLKNLEQVIRDMEQLQNQGITISIDDFGTGYSCLSYLRDLPVDVLKIDKSFITQLNNTPPNEVLVNTISTLAKSMSLKCIAEGVESKNQAIYLNKHGVDFLQGYYFSRPVPALDIRDEYTL